MVQIRTHCIQFYSTLYLYPIHTRLQLYAFMVLSVLLGKCVTWCVTVADEWKWKITCLMMEKNELLPLPVSVDARALKSNTWTSRAINWGSSSCPIKWETVVTWLVFLWNQKAIKIKINCSFRLYKIIKNRKYGFSEFHEKSLTQGFVRHCSL